jgi:hypothetical protein
MIQADDVDAKTANAFTVSEIELIQHRTDTMPTPLDLLLGFMFPDRKFEIEAIGRLGTYILQRHQKIRSLFGSSPKN